MISIHDSITELERSHQIRDLALACYLAAIRNIADYAVELDDGITAPHRKYLSALADELAVASPQALQESQSTLRALLRDYRDKSSQYLTGLHNELNGTARALQELLDSLAQADGDHDGQLRDSTKRLRAISNSPEAAAVRARVLAAVDAIEQSAEQRRQQYQLTVSQFLVEIRMLHKRIDTLETAVTVDNLTKLYTRREMEQRIRHATEREYCLLLLKVNGFASAERTFGRDVAVELTGAFSKRLRNSLPADTVIGRWGEEAFIALLRLARPDALTAAKGVSEHLSGAYSCVQDGKTHRPSLQISVGVVDAGGQNPDGILRRVAEFLDR